MTETERTNELYEDSKPIIATIFLDNYDEITQNMNDTQRSEINSMVTRVISRWAQDYTYLLQTLQLRSICSLL